jgi:hypothetical protein
MRETRKFSQVVYLENTRQIELQTSILIMNKSIKVFYKLKAKTLNTAQKDFFVLNSTKL